MSRNRIAAICLSLLLGCSDRDDSSGRPETLVTEYDQSEMDRAIAEARRTLPSFLERWKSPRPGDSEFFVKVRIRDGSATEHFWLGEPALEGERFEGTIDNDPGVVKNVRIGQRWAFASDDVSDWMYRDASGTVQGSYTTRVLLKTLPAGEARDLEKAMGW